MTPSRGLVALFACVAALVVRATRADPISYPIPNPFAAEHKGYFAIKSIQTTINDKLVKESVEVDEYFSLKQGLSYSVHRERDSPTKQWYAVIADGPRGKTYVVRPLSASVGVTTRNSAEKIECELDHAHNHKQVFPWQYVFDAVRSDDVDGSSSSSTDIVAGTTRGKNSAKWASKRFVYGVGAIWLNAVERKIASSQIGLDSPIAGANVWEMDGGPGVHVRLLFEKPDEADEAKTRTQVADMRKLIAESKLDSIHISRDNAKTSLVAHKDARIEHPHGVQHDEIVVKSFDKLDDPTPTIKAFFRHLRQCRDRHASHRVFPSLVRALSMSPSRLFSIEYLERKYGRAREPDAGHHDKTRRRLVWDAELHSELFSLDRQAQCTIYRGLRSVIDDSSPNKHSKLVHEIDEQMDVFLKRFTDNELTDGQHGTTAYYHIMVRATNDGHLTELCKAGDHEPMPPEGRLWRRPMHFHSASEDKLVSGAKDKRVAPLRGWLTGLGALLMNALDVHYKSFSMFKREITWVSDPTDIANSEHVLADEWQMHDNHAKLSYHFYFRSQRNEHEPVAVSDLLRVDVRDPSVDASAERLPSERKDVAEPDSYYEPDLLYRYDVQSIEFDVAPQRLDDLLNKPHDCEGHSTPDEDTADEADNNDSDSEWEDSPEDWHDSDSNSSAGDDSDMQSDADSNEWAQEHGDEFEFEPGKMLEGSQFPSFFEWLDGLDAFEFVSQISLLGPQESAQDSADLREKIYLRELFDTRMQIASYRFYRTREDMQNDEPHVAYYFNYNEEHMYKVSQDGHTCALVDELDTWAQALAVPWLYSRVAHISETQQQQQQQSGNPGEDYVRTAIVDADKLPLLGVGGLWMRASQSEYSYYVGLSRKQSEAENGHKLRDAVWAWHRESDANYEMRFKFKYDQSAHEEATASKRHRPLIELLELDSIETTAFFRSDEQEFGRSQPSKFERFAMRVESSRPLWRRVIVLPRACQSAMAEAAKRDEKLVFASRLPPFSSYIGQQRAYVAHYTVLHGDASVSGSTQLAISESYDLNDNRGVLRVGSGADRRDIYIDGRNKRTYSYLASMKQCKNIVSVKPLIDASGTLIYRPNDDYDTNKLYGLANLWLALERLRRLTLTVKHKHDSYGNRYNVLTYKGIGQRLPSANAGAATRWQWYTVEVVFVEQRINRRTPDAAADAGQAFGGRQLDARLALKSVTFEPELQVMRSGSQPLVNTHRTSVTIDMMSEGPPAEWRLPDECTSLTDDGSAAQLPAATDGITPAAQPQPLPMAAFPRLSDYLTQYDRFHMRSELVMSVPSLGDTKRLMLLDEWLMGDKWRVQMRNTNGKRGLDVLVLGASQEVFDLSTDLVCSVQQVPRLTTAATSRDELRSLSELQAKSLAKFWSDKDELVRSLGHLYFGPAALWRLAEKHAAKKELVTDTELAPKSPRDSSQLAKELMREVWRVTFGDTGSRAKWSFDMHFERVEQWNGDRKQREWYVLQRIEATDTEFISIERKLDIEIVNYLYNDTSPQAIERLRVPEGRGCARGVEVVAELSQVYDELSADARMRDLYSYEASLEIQKKMPTGDATSDGFWFLDSEQTGDTTAMLLAMPTVSGWFTRRRHTRTEEEGDEEPDAGSVQTVQPIDLLAHFFRIRHPNGAMTSTKIVYDGKRAHHIDRMLAVCTIGDSTIARNIEIPFFDGATSTRVDLTEQLFYHLFLDTKTQGFKPLKRFEVGGVRVSVYEKSFDYLKVSDHLEGPAIVTRTFTSIARNLPKQDNGNLRQGAVSVRVRLFNKSPDEKPSKADTAAVQELKAVLTIALRVARSPTTSEFVKLADVSQCYELPDSARKLRDYALEYDLNAPQGEDMMMKLPAKRAWIKSHEPNIVEDLLTQLQRGCDIHELHFAGLPRIEFGKGHNDGQLLVHFRLLDPPAPSERMAKHEGGRMSTELESRTDMLLAASLHECERKCAEMNCAVMGYCRDDRVCRLASVNMLRERAEDGALGDINRNDIFVSTHDDNCDYFIDTWTLNTWPDVKRPHRQAPGDATAFETCIRKLVEDKTQQIDKRTPFAIALATNAITLQPSEFRVFRQSIAGARDDVEQPASVDASNTFKLLYRNRAIHLQTLPGRGVSVAGLPSYKDLDISAQLEHVQSAYECLRSCSDDDKCVLVSHCKSDQSCATIKGSRVNMKAVRKAAMTDKPESDGCVTYARDYLLEFTRFDSTAAPVDRSRELLGLTALECAAACKASASIHQDDLFDLDLNISDDNDVCLSFDYCVSVDAETHRLLDAQTGPVHCFLQKMHIMLDDFDRSIMSPRSYETASDEHLSCTHYSKPVLQDFKQYAGKKFSAPIASSMRGYRAESCAIDCHQSDTCVAFEYCFRDTRQPTQSCRFLHYDEEAQSSDAREPGAGDDQQTASDKQVPVKHVQIPKSGELSALLKPSKSCSVYRIGHFEERLEPTKASSSSAQTLVAYIVRAHEYVRTEGHPAHTLATGLLYVALALVLGACVQLAYMKLTGQPIELPRIVATN